jgi:hypothetical protein
VPSLRRFRNYPVARPTGRATVRRLPTPGLWSGSGLRPPRFWDARSLNPKAAWFLPDSKLTIVAMSHSAARMVLLKNSRGAFWMARTPRCLASHRREICPRKVEAKDEHSSTECGGYGRLLARIQPHPIKDEEEYDRLMAEASRLMGRGEQQLLSEGTSLPEMMAILIEEYDRKHYPLPAPPLMRPSPS